MAAMNKAQAQRAKRNTDYGAEKGEVTKGMKPGDRYYDADTNTWQKREGASSHKANDYLTELMNGGQNVSSEDRSASSRPTGTEGSSGSGSKGKGGAGTGGEGSPQQVPQGLEGNDLIDWLVRVAGMSAAAATAYARRNRGSSGPANPATDTAGEADKGGQGKAVAAPTPRPRAEGDVARANATAALEAPNKLLSDASGIAGDAFPEMSADARYAGPISDEYRSYLDAQAQPATPPVQPGPTVDAARAQQPMMQPNAIEQSIMATAGDDYVDPELRDSLEAHIGQGMQSGNFDPSTFGDPSVNKDLPMMDPAVTEQFQKILNDPESLAQIMRRLKL